MSVLFAAYAGSPLLAVLTAACLLTVAALIALLLAGGR